MPTQYRKIKWFKHERIYTLLTTHLLRTMYVAVVFSERYYNKINAKHIRRYHEIYDHYQPTQLESRVLTDLNRDGIAFARVDEFCAGDMLSRLQGRVDQLERNKGEAYLADRASYNKILDLNGDISDDPVISEWVLCRSFVNTASLYLELSPRCGTKQENLVIATPNEGRGAQLWHRDGSDKKITKVLVYLNDVDERNGPFQYMRGTHYKGALRDVLAWTSSGVWSSDAGRTANMLDGHREVFEGKDVICTGKAGQVIFADTSGFHRGGLCEAGYRRMIELSYYSKAAFISHEPYKIRRDYKFSDDPALKLAFGLD